MGVVSARPAPGAHGGGRRAAAEGWRRAAARRAQPPARAGGAAVDAIGGAGARNRRDCVRRLDDGLWGGAPDVQRHARCVGGVAGVSCGCRRGSGRRRSGTASGGGRDAGSPGRGGRGGQARGVASETAPTHSRQRSVQGGKGPRVQRC
eukprot:6012835-Pleurochrysis_carterae.AAC.2